MNVPYMFSTSDGRVENPDFLTHVAAACKKEDHLVVVRSSQPPGLLNSLFGNVTSELNKREAKFRLYIADVQGCNSGGRSLRACVDLLNVVSLTLRMNVVCFITTLAA